METAVHTEPEFISNIFIRPKKNGSHRLILNLRDLNDFIEYHHFKMDTIETVIGLMRPNCFMASLDLSNAYFSVPIAEANRCFLKFPWKDELYQFTVMPNGLTSAPRIFTKIFKPVYASLRKLGFIASGYIDDSFLMAHSLHACQENIRHTSDLFKSLGFCINEEKSMISPSHKMEHLGFILDATSMTVSLTREKQVKLIGKARAVLEDRSLKIRTLAELIGLIVSSFTGAEYGHLHYRTLEVEKVLALTKAKGNFDGIMCLSLDAKSEIQWWIDNVHTQHRNIDHGKFEYSLTTDASKEGWGAVLSTGSMPTGGRWTVEEKLCHINVLELKAGYLGLKSFCTDIRHSHVKLNMDNTTAIAYVNHMGGSHSCQCNVMAKDIWQFCIERNIWLTAAHLPGHLNVIADEKSRVFDDKTEWKLNAHVFQHVVQKLVTPNIDLFASRLNYQLKPYVSWMPDPEACHVDAFTFDWRNVTFYAFPPFSILNQVIRKIEADRATGILIVPDWPTQAWYPMLRRLMISQPIRLKWQANLVMLPFREGPHPLGRKLQLMACHLCGNHC